MRTPWSVVLALLSGASVAVPFPFDGFGRFGREHNDGLLPFNVQVGGCQTVGGSESLVASWTTARSSPRVIRINSTEKRLALAPTADGPSELHWTLLYPGYSMKAGTSLVVNFRTTDRATVVTQQISDGRYRVVLIGSAKANVPPVALAMDPRVRAEWSNSTLTLSAPHGIGEVRWISPQGIDPSDLDRARPQARQWATIRIPTLLSADSSGRFLFEGGIAPISPIHSFLKVPAGLQSGPQTRWGRFLYSKGRTSREPIPQLRSEPRGYVVPQQVNEEWSRLAMDLTGDTDNRWAVNAVDLAYSRRVPSLMAYSLMPEKWQSTVIEQMRRDLPRAFDIQPPTWRKETEPFTQTEYAYTYALGGPNNGKYDIEWGNLLPVYGLYVYVLRTGDLEMARRCWPGVRAAMRFVERGHDWAWMTNVNADTGFSTGTGDPVNAAVAGLAGAVHLAEMLKEPALAHRWRWIAQRTSVAASVRLSLTRFAESHGLIAPNRIALGFHETQNFTRSPLDADPWYPTSLFSGNGSFPELLAQYVQDNPSGLSETLDRLATAYPQWFEGTHPYSFKGTYNGNSVYVTYPHIFARLHDPKRKAGVTRDLMFRAASNRTHSWVAPNVIAEFLCQGSPLVLTGWGAAGLRAATYEGQTVHVDLVVPTPRKIDLSWRVRSDVRVASVDLHGQNVKVHGARAHVTLSSGRNRLTLRLRSANLK